MRSAKKHLRLLMVAVLTFLLLNIPVQAASRTGAFAMPVEYSLYVDGKSISLWAYEIEDSFCFKLRDVAMALNGTEKQFEVSWAAGKKAVLLTSGAAYTPVGDELSEPSNAAGAVAYSPATVFYLDDRQIPMRTYTVNGTHYIMLSDLSANLMFAAGCDDEEHLAKITTEAYYTGLYSFSLPEGWRAEGSAYHLQFIRSGEPVGELSMLAYEPGAPISRFAGNHAETLLSEELSGFDYPAAKAIIRRTQPAAAKDDSYVDELHIYIMLPDLQCAFDLCFDSARVDEQGALEIAKGLAPNQRAIKRNTAAAQWARAIQDRDGRAQYELLSTELQPEFYDYYDAGNWVTGISSPWVNSWTIEILGSSAVVFYENMTSTGFAGYTIDNLSFSEENGQLKISSIDGFNNFPGYNTSMQNSVELPESSILLAGLPGDNIFIYGDKNSLSRYGDLYEGLYLSINGVNRHLKWENTVKESFAPELALADINSDGKQELIVILTTGEGTGVRLSDIHVVDPQSFKETYVANPLDIIGKNIGSSIVHENGTVTITINVHGQKSVITFDEDYAGGWVKDKAVFGNIIRYSVEGSKLKATVPAQVSNTVFAGEAYITYTFDGYYVMGTIEFIPYDAAK